MSAATAVSRRLGLQWIFIFVAFACAGAPVRREGPVVPVTKASASAAAKTPMDPPPSMSVTQSSATSATAPALPPDSRPILDSPQVVRATSAYRSARRAMKEGDGGRSRIGYGQAIALFERAAGAKLALSFQDEFQSAPAALGFDSEGTLHAVGRFEALSVDRDDLWTLARWREPPLGYFAHTDMAMSPSARRVAFSPPGGIPGFVPLRHARDGTIVSLLQSSRHGFVTALAFSVDGQMLAAASWNGHIDVWTVTDATKAARAYGAQSVSTVGGLAYSPTSNLLATGEDTRIRIRDATSDAQDKSDAGKKGRVLSGHGSGINVLAFVPSGKVLLSGDNEGGLRSWNVATGTALRTFARHQHRVSSIVPLDDNRFLSASWDGTARLWNVSSSDPLVTYANPADLSRSGVAAILAVAKDPEDNVVVTSHLDGTVGFSDMQTAQERRRIGHLSAGVVAVAFASDAELMVAARDVVHDIRLDTKLLQPIYKPGKELPHFVHSNDISALATGAGMAVVGTAESKALVFELVKGGANWRKAREFPLPLRSDAGFFEGGTRTETRNLRVSSRGTYAAALVYQSLFVWRISDAQLLLREPGGSIRDIGFSDDERWLFVAKDFSVDTYSLPDATSRQALKPSSTPGVQGVELSALIATPTRLLIGNRHGTIVSYRLADAATEWSAELGAPIERLAGSGSGLLIAVLSDGRVALRSTAGQVNFLGGSARAMDVAISPSGRLAAVSYGASDYSQRASMAATHLGMPSLENSIGIWSLDLPGRPPSLKVAVHLLAHESAGILVSEQGRFDWLGNDTPRLRDWPRCSVGPYSMPLEACEEQLRDSMIFP